MKRTRTLLFLLLLTISCLAAPLASPPSDSVSAIQASQLRTHLQFLASKELGGRYTLSPSFAIAARYLATQLESYGYKGAMPDGSYFQPFEVASSKVDPEKSSLTIGDQKHNYGDFYNAGPSGGDVSGEVVFVGYGVSAPRLNHDDYTGLDVKGKIVLIAAGVPAGVNAADLKDEEQDEDAAEAHGAVGMFIVPGPFYVAQMTAGTYRDRYAERVRLVSGKQNPLPIVRLAPAVADGFLATVKTNVKAVNDTAKEHKPLTPGATGMSAKLSLTVEQTKQATQNVAGILEGTDPKLKGEYVTFSAHYDHLKTNSKGEIYPGADDDGSGTVSVLNIAQAMALHRPKRSVLIIFHAGEELGLLGSKFNADTGHIVPLEKMAIDINIDMIGRSKPATDTDARDAQLTDPNTIYAIGADKISPELDKIQTATNNEYAKLKIDYTLNDPNHPDRIYFRSDHWNYAKHGVPIIFYFDGVSRDYHQPTDVIETIDFDKMARVARLAYEVGWRVAQLDHDLQKKPEAASMSGN
jgi:hypothetical protein